MDHSSWIDWKLFFLLLVVRISLFLIWLWGNLSLLVANQTHNCWPAFQWAQGWWCPSFACVWLRHRDGWPLPWVTVSKANNGPWCIEVWGWWTNEASAVAATSWCPLFAYVAETQPCMAFYCDTVKSQRWTMYWGVWWYPTFHFPRRENWYPNLLLSMAHTLVANA